MKKVAAPEKLLGQRVHQEVKDDDGETIVRKGRKFTQAAVRKIERSRASSGSRSASTTWCATTA